MSAPEDHYPPEPIETWVLEHGDKVLARTRTWEAALGEAILRGLVEMKSMQSFTLKHWHAIRQETL